MSATRPISSIPAAVELREVLFGQPEQARDYADRELEGELAHQLGHAVRDEAVDLFVDDRRDELGLPAGQRLLPDACATRLRLVRCSGSSIPRITWPRTMPIEVS